MDDTELQQAMRSCENTRELAKLILMARRRNLEIPKDLIDKCSNRDFALALISSGRR